MVVTTRGAIARRISREEFPDLLHWDAVPICRGDVSTPGRCQQTEDEEKEPAAESEKPI